MAEKEYIERDKALFAAQRGADKWDGGINYERDLAIEEYINRIPAADVEEVRHGEWVLETTPDGKPYCFHCSLCDNDFHRIDIKAYTPYCPNCGAKMDGKGDACGST